MRRRCDRLRWWIRWRAGLVISTFMRWRISLVVSSSSSGPSACRGEGVAWWASATSTVRMARARDGRGEHGQDGVAVPAGPAADLVVVEPDLACRGLETLP